MGWQRIGISDDKEAIVIVTNATWEKRNLGLDVFEIQVEPSDTADDIYQLKSLDCNLSVLKIPTAHIDLIRAGEKIGYQFYETLIKHEIKSAPELNKIESRMINALDVTCSSEQEKNHIFAEIKTGLFNSDRYSLDPLLSPDQASNRYIGWISDELERNAQLFSIKLKKKLSGFFLINELSNRKFVSLLAGVFPKTSSLGIGNFINHLAYIECFRQGAVSVSTAFSSNNMAAAMIHSSLRTRILEQNYVFHKHHNGDKRP